MRAFETNDWLLLNSMIYRIYTTEDFEAMRQQFLEQLLQQLMDLHQTLLSLRLLIL